MNLLRESHRDLTKRLLNSLAKPLLVSTSPSLIRPVAVTLSLNFQANILTIKIKILLLIIRIARIAVHLASTRQVQVHHLKCRYIHIRTRKDEKLYGFLIERGDQLNSKTEKEPSLRRAFTARRPGSIFFAFHQSRATDADVIADGHRKRINHILVTQIKGLEKVRQIVEKHAQGRRQSMQSTVKRGFFKHNNALFISHVQHSRGLITPEETGRYDGGSQHNTVRYFRVSLWFDGAMMSRFKEKITRKQ